MEPAAFLAAFVSVFAIVNPIGSIPVFVTLTQDYSRSEKLRVIRNAVIVGTAVLVVFGLAGQTIFNVFGITIPAFRIAGGLLIGKYAFELLQGERPKADSNDREIADALERESVGVTPLGVPLLAGPGAITTVMILVSTNPSADHAWIYAAVVLVFVASFVLLVTADRLLAFLGRSGLMIFARLMGLLLAAVAVQFVIGGLQQVAPGIFPA